MKKFINCIIILLIGSNIYAQDVTLFESYQSTIAVIVDITQPWVNSGINLSQGDKIDIISKGIATSNESNSNWWCGPEGLNYFYDTRLPLPDQPNQSLIAKVGESGTPFYVGRGISFISNVTGTLFFGYNDYGFYDNVGYYVAFVSGDSITTDIADNNKISDVPYYSLTQNYPNPFNPSTTINYSVPGASNVNITIYDINGQVVKNLLSEFKNSGSYSVNWDGKTDSGLKASSGTYFYQVQIGNFVQTKKMILLK